MSWCCCDGVSNEGRSALDWSVRDRIRNPPQSNSINNSTEDLFHWRNSAILLSHACNQRHATAHTAHDSRTLHNNIYLLVEHCFWASIGRAFLIYFILPHLFIAFSAFINIIHFPSLLLSPLSSQVQWNERSSQNGCKSFIRNSTSWYETPQTKQTWTIISYYHVYTVDIYIKCVTLQCNKYQ